MPLKLVAIMSSLDRVSKKFMVQICTYIFVFDKVFIEMYYIQKGTKRYVNLAKQDPGKVRQCS